jgi:hypothetical protein
VRVCMCACVHVCVCACVRLGAAPRGAPWAFEETAIFAQVDAFVERCRNLMEVCEGQVQFARKSVRGNGGQKAPLPSFGGSRGPEIVQVRCRFFD